MGDIKRIKIQSWYCSLYQP